MTGILQRGEIVTLDHPAWKRTAPGRLPQIYVPQKFLRDLIELPELQGRIANKPT